MRILTWMKPLIGIPLCHDANRRIHAGREYLYSDIAYTRAIDRAGGVPLHLPIQRDAAALVDHIDALLLPGGDDFLPPSSCPDPSLFDPASEIQIAFDRDLLRTAIERDRPILGICYGSQLMGLELGAALHYHLPDDLPEAQDHRLDEVAGRHDLEIEAETLLYDLLATRRTRVNSLHHQALAHVGHELRVAARCPDGVIEAFEHPGKRFCLGVQWHPEKLAGPDSDALFAGLVAAATREGH